jgi:DNA (cytosine-5)-methyltransferase 1
MRLRQSCGVKPKAIDLFSGCGGLTLGLKQAGFRVIGAVEVDELAVETYRVNHSEVKVWPRKIQEVTAKEMMRKLKLETGKLDLLAGCPPCQGFSTMTTLNGKRYMRDSRNELLFEFLRFVRVLKPKVVMMENVPRLGGNWRMRKFIRVLRSLGYVDPQCKVLDASQYAVPQRRRRMILLASRLGPLRFAKPAKVQRTVESTLMSVSWRTMKRDLLHNLPEQRTPKMLKQIKATPKDGGSRSDLGRKFRLKCHRHFSGFKDVYGRMAWKDVAPTITGGCCNPSKGRFLHPDKDRCISLREAAMLQSFPVTYFFSIKRGKFPAAQMIGNALPPEFIRRHARQVRRHLE